MFVCLRVESLFESKQILLKTNRGYLSVHVVYGYILLVLSGNRENCITKLTHHGMLAKDENRAKAVLRQTKAELEQVNK